MHACMYAWMYVCMYVYACIYRERELVYVCVYARMYVHIYACACIYIYICMHAFSSIWWLRAMWAGLRGAQLPSSSAPRKKKGTLGICTRAQASPWSLRLVQVELAPANWKTLPRAFKVGHVAGDIPFLLVEPKAWKPEKDYFYSYSFLVILIFVCLLLLRSRCHCHDLQAGVPRKTPKLSQNGMRGRLI